MYFLINNRLVTLDAVTFLPISGYLQIAVSYMNGLTEVLEITPTSGYYHFFFMIYNSSMLIPSDLSSDGYNIL